MRFSSSEPWEPSEPDSSNPLLLDSLLDNVVVFPDGTVTWALAAVALPEIIPSAACEVVPEWYPLPDEFLKIPQPHAPEMFATVPEFAPIGR